MKSHKEALASWRPTVAGQRVRTFFDEERRAWLMVQEVDGAEFTEEIHPEDDKDLDSVQLAELREVNRLAPLLAKDEKACNGSPRVYPDHEGHYSAWVPCVHCGGYRWQLALPIGDIDAGKYSEEVEREMARLLAHRVLWGHGKSREKNHCPGCIEDEMRSGDLGDKELVWFSVTYQQWQARLLLDGEMAVDISLGLPAWATSSELEESIKSLVGKEPPFDQEKD